MTVAARSQRKPAGGGGSDQHHGIGQVHGRQPHGHLHAAVDVQGRQERVGGLREERGALTLLRQFRFGAPPVGLVGQPPCHAAVRPAGRMRGEAAPARLAVHAPRGGEGHSRTGRRDRRVGVREPCRNRGGEVRSRPGQREQAGGGVIEVHQPAGRAGHQHRPGRAAAGGAEPEPGVPPADRRSAQRVQPPWPAGRRASPTFPSP